MSLNWNAEKVKGWKEIEAGLRDEAIWSTMFVDMGAITPANVEDFIARCEFHQKLFGAWMIREGKPIMFTEQSARLFVGLSTNVSTITWLQFVKKAQARFLREKKEALSVPAESRP